MNFKKFRSYAFIMSLTASIVAMLNAFGSVFNFSVDGVVISSIVTAVLGVLVTLGLVVKDNDEIDNKTDIDIKSEKDDSE